MQPRNKPTHMKTKALLTLGTLLLGIQLAGAQGNGFTYQGRLTSGTNPVNGSYDFRFRLATDSLGNNYVGGTLLTNGVPAANGLFTVTLDFGGGVFTGTNLWLEVGVRTNGGGGYTTLMPLQALTTTPYAITAGNLSGPLPAAQFSGTYGNPVTLNNAANNFTGNGTGLTNVNAAKLGGLSASNFWKTTGNAGANPAEGAFFGTTDNLPLELRVNGQRALRLEPNPDGAPNMIGGSPANFVASNVVGAVIAGGGALNSVSANFGTIGGGFNNTIRTNAGLSTISGGSDNTMQSNAGLSTIGGGSHHTIRASYSTIGGGYQNSIQTGAGDSTICGGADNLIQPGASEATIGGGFFNGISGSYGVVPGGDGNNAGASSFAAGHRAKANHTGSFVWADSTDADFATSADNQFLIRAAGGVGIGTGTPSARLHVHGDYSNTGAGGFMLDASDSANPEVYALRINPFVVGGGAVGYQFQTKSAVGGTNVPLTFDHAGRVGIGTTSPTEKLHVAGNILATGTITPNSDRNAKTGFAPVDASAVLEKVALLPIQQWRFKTEEEGVKHVGPMAQDFHAAFGVGTDDKHIATVDADGVALAAIQGLNEKLTDELKRRDAENAELKQELVELRKLVQQVNEKLGGGAR